MMNPKIRFKKSDGSDYQDWKVDNINELFGISTGKCITTAEADADGLYDVISGGTKPLCKTNKYNRNANTITVARAGTAGYVMFQTNDFYLNDKCFSLIPIDENIIDSKFGFYELKNREYDIIRLKTDNVVPTINTVSLGSVKVYYPTDIEEQTKIANFLSEIDNLIASAEHEVESTKQLKKAMLQKMFPKKGEKFPEIRFPEFTDAWEQRKFSDFAQRESAVQLSSYDCPCVEYEDVIAEEGRLNKDILQKEVQKSGIKFDGTQVLYGKLRPYLHNWLNPDFTGVAVGDWWVLRPIGIDKNYLYRLIQTKQFDDVANQSTGSKMPRADWNLVSNTEFFIPASMEEQSKIAMTFTNLDTLITLHQRKLDAYKKFKKAMMQKMFV